MQIEIWGQKGKGKFSQYLEKSKLYLLEVREVLQVRAGACTLYLLAGLFLKIKESLKQQSKTCPMASDDINYTDASIFSIFLILYY